MDPLSIDWDADSGLPIDLELVKAQLRITHEEFDELIMEVHLPAAVRWAEGEMHRSILAKEHRWVLPGFPQYWIRLPRGKTQAVSDITYVSGGQTIVLTGPSSGSPVGADYREDLRGDGGGRLHYIDAWPTADCDAPAPAVITFTAGWTQAQVPADIKQALIMYVSDALEVTGAADLMTTSDLGMKDTMLSSWRLFRW